MNIRSQANNFSLSRMDENYIRSRVILALTTYRADLDAVHVWLFRISGIESDNNNQCRVEVTLRNGHSIIGDSSALDLYAAIDRAVERAACKTACSLERHILNFHRPRAAGFRGKRGSAAAYRENSL